MFSLPWFLLLMLGSVVTFRAGGDNGRPISGLVYVSVWSLFPRRCQWLWTESHIARPHPLILCTTQASIQVAMTLLDLGAPSILGESQDRQVQNWAFFRVNQHGPFWSLGEASYRWNPRGYPGMMADISCVLRNPRMWKAGELKRKSPSCRCVNTPSCLSLQGLSENLLASPGDSGTNHT